MKRIFSSNFLQTQPGVWDGPAFYVGPDGPFVFYGGNGEDGGKPNLVRFNLTNNTLIRPMINFGGMMITDPKSEVPNEIFPLGGGTPIVTSDQGVDNTGIVWVVKRADRAGAPDPQNLNLLAYDARDLRNQLFKNQFGKWGTPKQGGGFVGGRAFIEPVVINGKVYVAHLDNNSTNFYVSVFSL